MRVFLVFGKVDGFGHDDYFHDIYDDVEVAKKEFMKVPYWDNTVSKAIELGFITKKELNRMKNPMPFSKFDGEAGIYYKDF